VTRLVGNESLQIKHRVYWQKGISGIARKIHKKIVAFRSTPVSIITVAHHNTFE